MADRNFIKVSLPEALAVTHDYDICLSESFLDVSVSNEDERIRIEGYNLLQADHPSNKKREVLHRMYYIEHLLIIKRGELYTLKECLVTEIIVGKKSYFFYFFLLFWLYRLPSQTKEEFEEFCTDLNILLSNLTI